MRNYLLLLFFLPWFGYSQQLTILSAKDSTAVPFAFITIKGNGTLMQKMAGNDGVVEHENMFNDSVQYSISVKSTGFNAYNKIINGFSLKRLRQIYLQTASGQLEEVVITSQYQAGSAEKAVQKIKVIDSKKIEQMGAVNLRDVLTNQLNVRLQQDNILGSGMTCLGTGGENVKILLDGVPMIGRLNGNIDLSQINLNNVERIEIIEGPLSVQYGTNALAGTINIITKKPTSKKQQAGAESYYESIGTYNANLHVAIATGKRSFQLNAGRNYFDGWISGDRYFQIEKPKPADSSRYKQWKPREQYFADAAYNFSIRQLNLAVKSAFFHEGILNRGYPRAPYGETSFDDEYSTLRVDNNLQINGQLNRKWKIQSLSAVNYYRRIKKTVFKDLTTLNEVLSSNSGDQDTSAFSLYMSRASFIFQPDSGKINYEFGYDLNYETALGKRIENQLQGMADLALFSTCEYSAGKRLVIKPGLRYTYNTAYKAPLVPSINLHYQLKEAHHLRASYGRGFRAPAIKELYFYFVDINHNISGNKNLIAETSNNFMLSYTGKQKIKNSTFKFELGGFYNEIKNLITLGQISGTAYSYINIGTFKTMGLQSNASIQIKQFSTQLGFTYTGRYNELTEEQPYRYSPEIAGNLHYTFKKLKAGVSLFYKYNGKLPNFVLVENKVQQNFIQDYQIMDLTVDKQIWKNRIKISTGCKNLFNVTNINANLSGGVHSSGTGQTAIATGRNYFLKISIQLEKAK